MSWSCSWPRQRSSPGAAAATGDDAGSPVADVSTQSDDDGWAGSALGEPQHVPDFTLTDQDGKRVRLADFSGQDRPRHVPLHAVPGRLPAHGRQPERGPASSSTRLTASRCGCSPSASTPSATRPPRFAATCKVHRLLPQFRYLIGSRRKLTEVWRKYEVQAVATDPELIDHTAYTLLIDRSGRGIVIYPPDFTAVQILTDLRRALARLDERTAARARRPGAGLGARRRLGGGSGGDRRVARRPPPLRAGVRPAAEARQNRSRAVVSRLDVRGRGGRRDAGPRLPARRDRGGVPPLGPHAPARAHRGCRAGARRHRSARAADVLPPARGRAPHRSRRSVRSARPSASCCARGSRSGSGPSRSPAGTFRPPTSTPSRARLVHDLEHATFVARRHARLDPDRRPGPAPGAHDRRAARRRRPSLFAAGQVLANILVFSFSPLYGAYAAQDERLLGLSPLTDQRLAGLVMMVEQIVMLGLAARSSSAATTGRGRTAARRSSAWSPTVEPARARRPFTFEPLFLALAVVAAVVYAAGRAARAGAGAGGWRPSASGSS